MADISKSGTEIFFLIVVVLGILIAISIPNKPLSLLVILLAGFAAGKVVYTRRHKSTYPKQNLIYFIIEEFPYIIISFAFFLGFYIGSFNVSRKLVIILFAGSFLISYYFHYKKIFVYPH
tara:strand:- start:1719 stop:2078 length:360 start_codon:yes stop_codon:yes gene_type:complete